MLKSFNHGMISGVRHDLTRSLIIIKDAHFHKIGHIKLWMQRISVGNHCHLWIYMHFMWHWLKIHDRASVNDNEIDRCGSLTNTDQCNKIKDWIPRRYSTIDSINSHSSLFMAFPIKQIQNVTTHILNTVFPPCPCSKGLGQGLRAPLCCP